MIPVSVVVMTRNEAQNIGPCLEALSRFDQVFVVDSGSGDGTAEIAAGLGATVVPFQWNGAYPKKKQWCLENLPFRHVWVLYCDADERITPQLGDEIALLMSSEPGQWLDTSSMASRSSAAYGTVMAHGTASWRFSIGGARLFRRFRIWISTRCGKWKGIISRNFGGRPVNSESHDP